MPATSKPRSKINSGDDVSVKARVRVAEFIAHVRQEAQPQPLAIKVVNASDFRGDKVLTVKRDDTGKMTGASVSSVD